MAERQAWCYLQVKLCDLRLSALSVVATIKALYKYTSFLFLFCLVVPKRVLFFSVFNATRPFGHLSCTDFDHFLNKRCESVFACVHSFVCYCGQRSSLLWTPARRPSVGPVHLPMKRGAELVGVCVTCREGRLSRHEQLVGYLLDAPPQGVVYCLARPGWNLFSGSPLALLQR